MADLPRLGQAMILNLWSALVIFLSAVLIFPLLDFLLARLRQRLWLSLWLAMLLVGTLAQMLTFPALQAAFDVPLKIGIDNWDRLGGAHRPLCGRGGGVPEICGRRARA